MDILVQQSVNALALGGTYALLALGLAMVFSVLGLINFAHGELMTATGYAMFFCIAAGMPFPLAVLIGIAVAVFVAVAGRADGCANQAANAVRGRLVDTPCPCGGLIGCGTTSSCTTRSDWHSWRKPWTKRPRNHS